MGIPDHHKFPGVADFPRDEPLVTVLLPLGGDDLNGSFGLEQTRSTPGAGIHSNDPDRQAEQDDILLAHDHLAPQQDFTREVVVSRGAGTDVYVAVAVAVACARAGPAMNPARANPKAKAKRRVVRMGSEASTGTPPGLRPSSLSTATPA